MGSVAAAAVNAVHITQGLDAARALVDRIARLPSPGGDFWRAAAQLEAAAAAAAAAGGPGVSPAAVQVSLEPPVNYMTSVLTSAAGVFEAPSDAFAADHAPGATGDRQSAVLCAHLCGSAPEPDRRPTS